MDAERIANAETADEVKDAAGTGGGPSGMDPSSGGPREESRDSFYGDTQTYPAGAGLMPPTGHADRPEPSEAISEADAREEGGSSPRQ